MILIFEIFIIALCVIAACFFTWLYWITASYLVDAVWQIHGLEGFAIKVVVFVLVAGLICMISLIGQKSEANHG
jgi:hypothetical protein